MNPHDTSIQQIRTPKVYKYTHTHIYFTYIYVCVYAHTHIHIHICTDIHKCILTILGSFLRSSSIAFSTKPHSSNKEIWKTKFTSYQKLLRALQKSIQLTKILRCKTVPILVTSKQKWPKQYANEDSKSINKALKSLEN